MFVPVVLLITLAAFAAWMIWGTAPALACAVTWAVSVITTALRLRRVKL